MCVEKMNFCCFLLESIKKKKLSFLRKALINFFTVTNDLKVMGFNRISRGKCVF